MNNLTAIILAAGRGKRMGVLTKDIPKPLINVNGKPLLYHAIDFVKKVGAKRIIVVGGYCFNKLKSQVLDIDESIIILENKEYLMQNLTSFKKSLSFIDQENVLVCNSDYVFNSQTSRNVSKKMRDISVFCSYDLSCVTEDVMRSKSDDNGYLLEMSKTLKNYNSVYTGVFFFSRENIDLVKISVESVFKKISAKDATVECLFGELMNRKQKILASDVGKSDWVEIDTPEELKAANAKFKL